MRLVYCSVVLLALVVVGTAKALPYKDATLGKAEAWPYNRGTVGKAEALPHNGATAGKAEASPHRNVHREIVGLGPTHREVVGQGFSLAAIAQPQQATPSANADFKIFVRGKQVGTEEVSVVRTSAGTVISGRGRLSAPLDVETNSCEVRYDAQWRPVEVNFDAIVHGQYTVLHTTFANGTATTQMAQAGQQLTRTAKVASDPVVLLNAFFSLYEALALRLPSLQPGASIPAVILPQQAISVLFKSAADERIQVPGRTINTRHYLLTVTDTNGPSQIDLWTDENHRLLHLSLAAQSFDMLRSDIATVSARREVASRPGDEPVKFPGNGFTLAGTVSLPTAAIGAKPASVRLPAVVLVAGQGVADRDEYVFDIPIFGQIANALADAGYVVLRYDKRGVGQSGGRADAATIEEYGDDARAAIKYLQTRKDVDDKRVAVAGYAEGGWAGMLAAEHNKDVAALALIATPGVTGADLVLAQQRHQLEGLKLTAAEQQARIDLQKKIDKAVVSGTGWEGVPDQMRRQADTPWFRSFLLFDPAKVMPDVRQPILILQGDLDRQVFAAQADKLAQLARARKGETGKEVTIVHLPAVNHLLVPATSGEYDEYARLSDRNVSKDLLAALVKWLNDATRKAR